MFSHLNCDLTDPRWMYLKAGLFLAIGGCAVGLILWEHPEWKLCGLLCLAIWSFARCYYFAFYVIEKYVDPSFKFAGLGSVVVYLLRRRSAENAAAQQKTVE